MSALPEYDDEAVRLHVGMVHILARGVEGDVVVCAYGEDPAALDNAGKPGRKIPGFVARFAVGDVQGTAAAILSQQGRAHSNCYMPLHIVRSGLAPNSRGGRKDIVAVLGLVVDADADKSQAPRRIDLKPSFVIESSPGNEQQLYLFDRPLPVDQAERLAWALKLATNSDSGTGDVAHVWRVPGGLNWPNSAKIARGRPAAPAPVRVLEPWDGSRVSVADLEAVLAPWLSTPKKGAKPDPLPLDDDDREPIELDELSDEIRELVELGTIDGDPPPDRSAAFMRAVLWLHERGHGRHRIVELLECNPIGIGEKYDGRVGVEVERVIRKAANRARRMFDEEAAQAAKPVGSEKAAPGSDDKPKADADAFSFGLRDGSNEPVVSEDEAELQFVEAYRGKLRFSVSHGRWFVWDGMLWRENATSIAFHRVREHIRRMAAMQPSKVRIVAGRATFAGAVERFARADPEFAVTAEVWDRDPMLLGTPGGTVDLRTGELRPARAEDGISRSTSVAPSDTADAPLWLRFLSETFGGDAAMIAFAQRWAGYCLTGLTREHALLFGHGSGGNGKSVYVNVHVGIAGDYATTASMDTFISSHGDRHSTDLAMLRGARLVTASETEEGRQWAESRIKSLTGGDRITARFMRQDFFTFTPTFKLLIVGNHKPGLKNVDAAARRRFNLVPFTNEPAVKDPLLEDKLRVEWPAILRWMVEGCLLWQRDGLAPPASVREATAAYFDEQNVLAEWMADRCVVDRDNPHRQAATAELFASWSAYAKAANEPAGTERALSQRLEKEGFTRKDKVPTFGGGRARGFAGIEIRREATQREAAE